MNRLKDAMTIAMVYNVFKEGSARIAGGCLRDLKLGREPKDIDILIEYGNSKDYDEAHLLAERLGYSVENCSDGYEDTDDTNLRHVYKLTKVNKLPIDLIFLNCTVKEQIERFPCSLTEIWLEGHWINTTKEFGTSLQNQTLIFREDTPEEYRQRMIGYFPTYKVETKCTPKKT